MMILVGGDVDNCMLREDLADGDVDLLHIERSLSIFFKSRGVYHYVQWVQYM
jgi:hypothetical protein